MKANISLALNAILIIAVIYLFTQLGDKPAATPATQVSGGSTDKTLEIVYIDVDTLLQNYTEFRERQESLAARQQEASQRISGRMKALEKEFMEVQAKVQQGLLAPNQIAEQEQRLGKKQQSLVAEQERLSQTLGAEQQELSERFRDRLVSLMDSLRDQRGYDYILQYGQGSGVLGARDSFNITAEVLEILNAEPLFLEEGEEKE
jgi:outer membrane protein